MTELRAIPMTLALTAALGWFAFVMYGKTRLVLMAVQRPEFFAGIPERIQNLFVFGIGQKKMFKEKGAGWMHAFIFWGFLVLQLRNKNHIFLDYKIFLYKSFCLHFPKKLWRLKNIHRHFHFQLYQLHILFYFETKYHLDQIEL